MKFDSIAIVGAGALGSYYGARLALAGANVRFLLRGDLAHVRSHGLTLREKDATRHLDHVAGFATAAEIGPVDLVIVTLKTTANASLPVLLPPLIGSRTAVITLQNGLGNEELIASIVGTERVLGGLCYIGVTREAPGELVGYHTPGRMTLGELNRPAGERVHAVAGLFSGVGVHTRVLDRLAEARWQKLIWNVPFNGLAVARGGLTTDRLLAEPVIAAEVRPLMDEVAAAARHFGYDVSESFIQSQIDVTPTMGAYAPSSLVDFLAGREVEVEAIWGEPLRRAQAAGLAMPRLAALYRELLTASQRS
ncbi:2-dehydropantoate 2-reductase [Horticoccus sp. 23ND18S-11]|uniref:2-dehydropantoate 2-reductase n=1 Tax=Horticoccus sp. 23ND18S-11 TaxID=3391832 RepID=UPI0039C90273